ncbi:MAG: hypothetical protein WCT39_07025, partial [Candidatus Margulisiibacteriota bacterium]
MKILLLRIGILLVGVPLLLKMIPSVIEFLTENLKRRALWAQDAIVAIALFCVANLLGTLYVFFIQATAQLGLFYASTTIEPIKLNILFGPINPYGIIFGFVIVLFYAICRQGMGRALSVLCVLMFMFSSSHLQNLIPSILRDYARVPFILAEVLIMAVLVRSPFKQNEIFALSCLAGIILGIGLWIREDLMLFALPFVLLLLFFLSGSLRENLKTKITACIVFVMFALVFMPTTVFPSSRNSVRVLGGLMSPSDARLNITGSIYDWGYQFSDEFAADLPYAQASVINPHEYFSSSPNEFSRAGSEYLSSIFHNFPADILLRAYSSTLKIMELPFTYTEPPMGVTNQLVGTLYQLKAAVLDKLAGFGILFVVLALLMISLKSFREALFCLFFLLYFTGYPSLQFQGRHYFHLEFITWWCFGFVVQHGLIDLKRNNIKDWQPLIKRALSFTLIILLISFVPIYGLRQYQSWRMVDIMAKCTASDIQRLPVKIIFLNNGMRLITDPNRFKPAQAGVVSGDYLMAEFARGNSKFSTLWPIISYERIPFSGRPDFSRTISVNLGKGVTRLFFPVIYNNLDSDSIYFKGVKMSGEQAACLLGLYRVNQPAKIPLLLTIQYPLINGEGLYKKISGWELSGLHTIPLALSKNRVNDVLTLPIVPIRDNDIAYIAKSVVHVADKWVVGGYAQTPIDPYNYPLLNRKNSVVSSTLFADLSIGTVDTDIIRTKGVWLKKGCYFIARGELRTGGVTFGLIKNKQTSGSISVTNRGPFTIIIEVPMDGTYSLGVANFLDGYTSIENRFVINKMGW